MSRKAVELAPASPVYSNKVAPLPRSGVLSDSPINNSVSTKSSKVAPLSSAVSESWPAPKASSMNNESAWPTWNIFVVDKSRKTFQNKGDGMYIDDPNRLPLVLECFSSFLALPPFSFVAGPLCLPVILRGRPRFRGLDPGSESLSNREINRLLYALQGSYHIYVAKYDEVKTAYDCCPMSSYPVTPINEDTFDYTDATIKGNKIMFSGGQHFTGYHGSGTHAPVKEPNKRLVKQFHFMRSPAGAIFIDEKGTVLDVSRIDEGEVVIHWYTGREQFYLRTDWNINGLPHPNPNYMDEYEDPDDREERLRKAKEEEDFKRRKRDSMINDLNKMKDLRNRGVLSDTEFTVAQVMITKAGDFFELRSMKDSGLLSEQEFNVAQKALLELAEAEKL